MRCVICSTEQGHAEGCFLLRPQAVKEAWDLANGHPCGLDKQFLEAMKISWA